MATCASVAILRAYAQARGAPRCRRGGAGCGGKENVKKRYAFARLTRDKPKRYARHIVLREVGGPGQAALKAASVLVIGAGGLGAPALKHLGAARGGTA